MYSFLRRLLFILNIIMSTTLDGSVNIFLYQFVDNVMKQLLITYLFNHEFKNTCMKAHGPFATIQDFVLKW